MNMPQDRTWVNSFSFKSVIVGAVVAFGLMFMFNLLTIGGGLAAYTRTEKGLETLISLAYAWTIVGSFLIFFVAGLVTSFVAHHSIQDERPKNQVLHGFVTWAIYILISLAFLAHASEATVLSFPKSFLSVSEAAAQADTTASLNTETTGSNSQNKTVTPTEQKAAHKIGILTLAAFFVFFVEAIACCFGAWCAVEYRYGPYRKSV